VRVKVLRWRHAPIRKEQPRLAINRQAHSAKPAEAGYAARRAIYCPLLYQPDDSHLRLSLMACTHAASAGVVGQA
jgi:hypothetical protein